MQFEDLKREKTLEQMIACAKFFNAFSKLMHMEAHLVGHVIEPGTSLMDIVVEHNIIEEAKGRVVQEYFPLMVDRRSRNVDMGKS